MDSLYHFCKYLDEKAIILDTEIKLATKTGRDTKQLSFNLTRIKQALEVLEEERLRLLDVA